VFGAAALLSCFVLPVHLMQKKEVLWFISDERNWYPLGHLWPDVAVDSPFGSRADLLNKIIARGERPVVADRNIGYVGYSTNLPVVDILGLTDHAVAHMPLAHRGRPGHEKVASAEYLRSRGGLLSYEALFPRPETAVKWHGTRLYLGK